MFSLCCCPANNGSKSSSSFICPGLVVCLFHLHHISSIFPLWSTNISRIRSQNVATFRVHFHCFQSKHQKHQAFEAELHANADRIRGVIDTGNALIQRGACAGSEDAVKVNTSYLYMYRFKLRCYIPFNFIWGSSNIILITPHTHINKA